MRIPSEGSFTSRLRSAAVAARVGLWLGICFLVALVTGLISHYAQLDHQPAPLPASPSRLYQLTQGLHVVAGTAAIPLLLVKLWVVFPKLFQPMPRQVREALPTALERGSIAVLVSTSLVQLTTGVLNVAQWYPWGFSFRSTHYALAFVAVGALLIHIAVKLPVVRDALTGDVDDTAHDRPNARRPGPVSRRGVMVLAGASALATAFLYTAGTVPNVGRIAALSPRSRKHGIPINRTAHSAGVVAAASSSAYRLEVVHGGTTRSLTRDDLAAMEQRTCTLPIACVEGWSATGDWGGVRLRDLLDLVDAPRGREVRVRSIQTFSASADTVLPPNFADDDRTLLALMLDGETLSMDHGCPVRLIAPDRPGVMQTKWVSRIEVL
ncbi:molybdopterin-dependent oxidoreductase [Nocardioides albus]|uniref:DMSO/TMAO reductase YedYZ molybdopterin-dependent catalytic subunit n=1 Tax=Nocardioides albus TaxID=1841 RepID=A0A7W5A9J8_9ACTN|nr:molybdopterin-dependent oxidoreductase [Nocardioides albus]MBB3092221.1 DMSO/TMAO reductase YedYZ molybdopterin-dependent catalytic subunit [Nocardioides albus]GGU46627.1 molybdopterin-binding protein [Nocardioides albus]